MDLRYILAVAHMERQTEKRLVGTVGEGEDGAAWESGMETYTVPLSNREPVGICDMTEGALWQVPCDNLEGGIGWEVAGGSRGKEHMHTYGWFMLMYGRGPHSIVKQLSSN